MASTKLSQTQEDWTFLDYSTREFTHGFHQYPARMHPEIAKRMIAKYTSSKRKVVFDPFMGSGGVLVEAMLHHNNSVGIDVNPFAVLLAKVKTIPIEAKKLEKIYQRIISKSNDDFKNKIQYDNAPARINLPFWYPNDALKKLQILKNHVFNARDEGVKNFFKICFSMTSRRVSYQKNSIYKIYRMKPEKRKLFKPNAFQVFEKICKDNIKNMEKFYIESKSNGAKAFPFFGDTKNIAEQFAKVPDEILDDGKAHLVVTSPPYGDHGTTVAYGQFSKHPGLWLQLPEDELLDVDSVGLGGSVNEMMDNLSSETLAKIIKQVAKNDIELSKNKKPSRANDVSAFFYDLDKCLEQTSQFLKQGQSHLCFVVANRTVRRVKIRTDEILVELGTKYGFKHKDTIYRTIANKAMSIKNAPENITNSSGETMTEESIVVFEY